MGMPPYFLNPACLADRRKGCKVFAKYAKTRMIRLFLFAYFAVSFQFTYSQLFIIQLKDKVSGTPVEYAYVTARHVNGPVQDKQVTDIRGEAKLKVDLPAIIEISCIGYKNLSDTVTSAGTKILSLSPDYYQLDQVVVTGQFRPQPVDKSIYKINVIDARQFQLKAANNMGDLMKNDLSFQYRSEGVLGDFIRIRGLTGEYVKILIDGMPVTGRVADRIDLGQLSLYNVDHVEVIEGPMSVVYGSSALAGAINIITADYSDKKLLAQADAYYESVGTYNLSTALSAQAGKHTFSINAARNFFSGWGPEDTSRYKIWKPKLQYLAGFGYQYRRKKLRVSVYSDFLHEELRDPGALTLDNLYEKALDGYHFTTRWNNRANFSNTFNDVFVLNLQAGYSYYQKRKVTYLNDLVNLRKTVASDPDLHDTTTFQMFSARGFVSNIPGKKFEYQTGFDLNYESAYGKRTGGYKDISDLSGFMNLVYRPLPLLSLQPGIRVMYNSNYHAPLVYGFNVKFNPANFVLRASYARGFRAPSLKQLYLLFIDNNHEIHGNENLKAETADNFNISLNYALAKSRHALNLELDLFYNVIDNAIQLAINTQRPGWGMYFNVDGRNYRTKGAEAKIGYRFSPSFNLNAGIISTGRLRLNSKDQFAYSTDWVSSANYRFEKYKLQMALFYKYTDSYLEFAGNYDANGRLNGIAQQYIDGYHTLDFTATKDLFQNRLNLSAGVKNIFNVTLVNSFGSITIHGSSNEGAAAGYGRTFFVRLGYRFTKL
jgi:outer membrane receptor for ferrienterochelin and colicins